MPKWRKKMPAAFVRGYDDFGSDIPFDCVPFVSYNDRQEWKSGWLDAQFESVFGVAFEPCWCETTS